MPSVTKPMLCKVGVHVPYLRTLVGGQGISFSYSVKCLRCPITWRESIHDHE